MPVSAIFRRRWRLRRRIAIARRAPQPGERGLMVTIGPGVTVGLMLLSW